MLTSETVRSKGCSSGLSLHYLKDFDKKGIFRLKG